MNVTGEQFLFILHTNYTWGKTWGCFPSGGQHALPAEPQPPQRCCNIMACHECRIIITHTHTHTVILCPLPFAYFRWLLFKLNSDCRKKLFTVSDEGKCIVWLLNHLSKNKEGLSYFANSYHNQWLSVSWNWFLSTVAPSSPLCVSNILLQVGGGGAAVDWLLI